MPFQNLMVFTGNANPKLAADVAQRLGLSLGRADVGRFSDGEVSVEIQEHVRGNDVFVVQSTCHPSNDNLMELLVIVDALKRASAGRITAALPYFVMPVRIVAPVRIVCRSLPSWSPICWLLPVLIV